MTSNELDTSNVTLLSRKSLRRYFVVLILLLVVMVLVLAYQNLKRSSYLKISPIAVALELSFDNQDLASNQVILEYDYGYGFIEAHRQTKYIESSPQGKVLKFTISSWKNIDALKVRVKDSAGVRASAITFSKQGNATRLLLDKTDSKTLFESKDMQSLLGQLKTKSDVSSSLTVQTKGGWS